MYIEPWMALIGVAAFGMCAYFSYKNGHREGLLVGIEGAFSYLEKYNVIKLLEDGSIHPGKGKLNITGLLKK